MGRLRAARLLEAQAEKETDAAKHAIAHWLKEQRGVDIETLPIGEFINIEGVAVIEIGKRNKFDEKSFILSHPKLHAEFKKDFPIQYYKPQ